MIVKLLLFSLVVISLQRNCDAAKDELVENHRGFAKFVDKDKLNSYLSSFGANPTPNQAKNHEVFKRSSQKKKKSKKVLSTTTESFEIEKPEIPTRHLKERNNGNKNFTVSPRHVVHFELDDAKYSEEYEKLRQSRKLRPKRSTDVTNSTKRTERFITKDTFVEPKEFFKFSLSDAVIKISPADAGEMQESEKKNKRETSTADSTATDTKKIHVTHPMRGQSSTKTVSYDNISSKLQKMIDSALTDAVQKGKASEGDYLKFFYGDKIIKVPVSISKYISLKKEKEKEKEKETIKEVSSYPKEVSSYQKETSSYHKETSSYPKETLAFPKETLAFPKETLAFPKETLAFPKETLVYGKKEEPKLESFKLLGTKNAYFSLKNSQIKYEKPKFLPTIPTTTEKAESYVNFDSSPIIVPENEYKKSIYFYSNEQNAYYPKPNTMSSPGPVLFEDSIPSTTPTTIIHETPKAYDFKSLVYHPKHLKIVKDEIPITENVNEHFDYIPENPKTSHYLPLPPPTSYIEYAGNHDDLSHQTKEYEFGYQVSDYKTGNNFGHMQKSGKGGTKGEYSILLPDGRVQIVKYYADDVTGFHAEVSYTNVH